eukprot:gene7859-12330_t
MPHPTVTYEFTFPQNNKKKVIEKLELAIIGLPNFYLKSEYEDEQKLIEKSDVVAEFYTPTLKWLDVISFKCIDDQKSSCVFQATSSSTNVCCFCGSFCIPIRSIFSFVEGYSDHGQNQKHIEALIKHTKLKHEKKFVEKKGKCKTQ